MKVKRSANRLYKIIIESGEPKCLLSRSNENAWLWHSRLGHVNFKAMELMATNDMVRGFPKIVSPEMTCTGCLMSKQTRKPFSAKSKYSSSKLLELIHGDICADQLLPLLMHVIDISCFLLMIILVLCGCIC